MQKVEVYLYFPTFYLHIIIKFFKVNILVTFFIVFSFLEYIRSAISKKPQLMIDLLIKEIKLFKNKIEIYFNYSDKTRPDDDSRRVFIFYKKEDVIYIDKHLFCCDAEPFKYNLEFYIWILGKKWPRRTYFSRFNSVQFGAANRNCKEQNDNHTQ